MARMTLAEELAKLEAAQGLVAEISEAAEDLDGVADEGLTWRLAEACQGRQCRPAVAGKEDTAEFDLRATMARRSTEASGRHLMP